MTALNSFDTLRQLSINNKTYDYYSLSTLEKCGFTDMVTLPFSLKILLENLLRHEDGKTVKKADISAYMLG